MTKIKSIWQSDPPSRADLSNGQIIVQKTSGWWQFYVQAGAYDLPVVGTPLLTSDTTITDLYGPVPVAYVKFAPAKNTSILIGALPTLMGAENTFTFQNMNIERGLLWNQENSINRGVQVNQTVGKWTASLSWNDGYYSNRYSWLSGTLVYSNGAHSAVFSAMGNLGETAFQTLATPVQNNGSMYAIGYTYNHANWIVQASLQDGEVLRSSARGGAVLANRNLTPHVSLAARAEYLGTTGREDLLYGPRSSAWSATVTPTFRSKRFFVRGDLAWVRVQGDAPRNRPRAVLEAGFLF